MMKNKKSEVLKSLLPTSAQKKGNRYFSSFEDKNYCIFQGVMLGEEKENVFYPTLHLLTLHEKSMNHIIVNDSNVWQFSLGKDITDPIRKEIKNEKNNLFLVKTGHNEIIGVVEKVEKENRIIVYKNMWDIGHLLRRELNT